MGARRHTSAVAGGVMLAMMCLATCGSAAYPGSGSAAGGGPAATPRQVTPKSVGGSPGQGPVVVSSPAPLPGGASSSQEIVLHDRILVITSITRHKRTNQGAVLIDLNLVVRDTSGKAIRNVPTFFQLVGPEGDVFGRQDNSSDNFYSTINAHTSRSGMIEFVIPAAAASSLSLLYRPEVAADTALIRLKAG